MMMNYASSIEVDQAIATDKPVIVQFSAPWCAPCRAIAPVVERLAETYTDCLKFLIVNIDDAPILVARYNIRSVPQMLFLRRDALPQRFKESATFENLTAFIDRNLTLQ